MLKTRLCERRLDRAHLAASSGSALHAFNVERYTVLREAALLSVLEILNNARVVIDVDGGRGSAALELRDFERATPDVRSTTTRDVSCLVKLGRDHG